MKNQSNNSENRKKNYLDSDMDTKKVNTKK